MTILTMTTTVKMVVAVVRWLVPPRYEAAAHHGAQLSIHNYHTVPSVLGGVVAKQGPMPGAAAGARVARAAKLLHGRSGRAGFQRVYRALRYQAQLDTVDHTAKSRSKMRMPRQDTPSVVTWSHLPHATWHAAPPAAAASNTHKYFTRYAQQPNMLSSK